MSQPTKKGGGKGPPAKKEEVDKTGSKDKEKDKDETNSNEEEAPSSKPQSAGASSRDAAQKVLSLCQKGEWAPVDQVLKVMEKNILAHGEDANTIPLAGVVDLVS